MMTRTMTMMKMPAQRGEEEGSTDAPYNSSPPTSALSALSEQATACTTHLSHSFPLPLCCAFPC